MTQEELDKFFKPRKSCAGCRKYTPQFNKYSGLSGTCDLNHDLEKGVDKFDSGNFGYDEYVVDCKPKGVCPKPYNIKRSVQLMDYINQIGWETYWSKHTNLNDI